MADPLSLLRQYNISKHEIIERDDQITFGEKSFPKNVQTAFRCKGPKGSTVVEYYTLECLLYFLKNQTLLHPDYCRQAAEAKMPAVRRPDRKEVQKYLSGEIDTSPSIESDISKVNKGTLKRSHDDEGNGSQEKKPRVESTQPGPGTGPGGKKSKRKRNKKKKNSAQV